MRESFNIFLTKYCALVSSIFNCEENKIKKEYIDYLKSQLQLSDYSSVESLFSKTFKNNTGEQSLFEESELSVSFTSPLLDNLTFETLQTLSLNDRIILFLLVIDFFHTSVSHNADNYKLLEAIGVRFGLSHSEVAGLRQMVVNPEVLNTNNNILLCKPGIEEEIDKLEGSWIENNLPDNFRISNRIEIKELTESLTILYLERNKMFVIKCLGNKELIIEGSTSPICKFKILEPGSELRINNQIAIHYTDIKHKYLNFKSLTGISLVLENISYRHRYKNKGIKEISLTESSGQLIGILGKEGVGKTTLLELLAGRTTPDTGSIFISDYNLKTNRYLLKSIIGYVPEDDLLFDELTVFDNLMLNARMFFSNISQKELIKKVTHLLEKLDLLELRNTIVGTVFEKNLQPGQRRMLNIALELLREPKILLVDNPIYGLNTSESSKIIEILHEYTFEGNLVITSIRQTNHFAFKMFDRLWIIDEAGYLIYNDACYKASEYFIKYLNVTGLEEITDINTPENILNLVGLRITDASGKWGMRKISPEEWYRLHKENQEVSSKLNSLKSMPLPAGYVKLPNLETQFRIFSIRNFKIKFSNIWKIIITLLAGPVLALFLGFILRGKENQTYIFAENPNLPLYFFVSSLVCLILGLLISSNDIIKERNILNKEEYLEFSRFSYINSKIVYLFVIALFQTLLFAVTGNLMIGIKGMFIESWIVLFSICSFGVVAGLMLSSYFSNLKAIYERAIPIIVGLQIIFGAGVVKYKDLNLPDVPFVPVAGELMVTKWAYEALMVEQYKNNKYSKLIYPFEKEVKTNSYYTNTLLPLLDTYYSKCTQKNRNNDSVSFYLALIKNTLSKIGNEPGIFEFEFLKNLNVSDFDQTIILETKDYLTYLKLTIYEKYLAAMLDRNNYLNFLKDSLGSTGFSNFKNSYHNNAIAQLVQNTDAKKPYKIFNNRIYQITDPIFQKPTSDFGRSLLFVPQKKLRGEVMATLWFNITFIWLFSFLFYLILLMYHPPAIRKPTFLK